MNQMILFNENIDYISSLNPQYIPLNNKIIYIKNVISKNRSLSLGNNMRKLNK